MKGPGRGSLEDRMREDIAICYHDRYLPWSRALTKKDDISLPLPDELDALMERAFETEKSMFGPIPPTTPKPILVGPELLKWVASKDTKRRVRKTMKPKPKPKPGDGGGGY